MNSDHAFEEKIIHDLQHYLPSQLALKDFVHHNSLHAFQHLPFFDAIFNASNIFGIQVTFNLNEYRKLHQQGRIRQEVIEMVISKYKGADKIDYWKPKMLNEKYQHSYHPKIGRIRAFWKSAYHVDINNLVQPTLFRIINSYLDQGIALWHFPFEDEGLLAAIRKLEKNSFASFFNSKRVKALLLDQNLSISKLLKILVGDEKFYEGYILDQQFAHKGWSGIVASIEGTPQTLLYQKKVHLKDFIILELLLEIDALDKIFGPKWSPLGNSIDIQPIRYFDPQPLTAFEEVLALWQLSFEWDYYDKVLAGLVYIAKTNRIPDKKLRSFQAVFCIDDREGSLRRHLETADVDCETYGAPGFFGAAFFFQPFGGKFYEKNAPVPASPKHLIKEIEVKGQREHEIFHSKHSHTFFRGFVIALALGLWAPFRLILDLFRPKMRPDITDAFAHMNIEGKLLIENLDPGHFENGLQVGYKPEEMADVVYSTLAGIGLTDSFAPIVYMVAHGSSSANNPHHGAYDCGACSGRPGAVNARVFAFMANHPKVREILAEKGVIIPDSTQFIGSMHDTASDEIAFYDVDSLSEKNAMLHQTNVNTFETALDNNAKERARRFASINLKKGTRHVRKAIKHRSVSYFEPRPELGHGTNALCYVGGREKLKGLFLDRRAFLQSYDYRHDPDGMALASVLGPLPVVCGGINLEYFFSRMDNQKMGAGTKLPHNVMGLIAVANSSDGDLRPGLVSQMVETHDPVRLLMIIEQIPETILNLIIENPNIKDWFTNDWIHLVVISPEDHQLYRFVNNGFEPYQPISLIDKHTEDIMKEIEEAQKMRTNHILDATRENMPVHIYLKR